jgi:hypothetical protein
MISHFLLPHNLDMQTARTNLVVSSTAYRTAHAKSFFDETSRTARISAAQQKDEQGRLSDSVMLNRPGFNLTVGVGGGGHCTDTGTIDK